MTPEIPVETASPVSGPGRSVDVFVLDDQPTEVQRVETMLAVLGFSSKVLPRLQKIDAGLKAVRKKEIDPPSLIVMDLWWNFENPTFERLGRPDVKVPAERHLRGLSMLRDVLLKDPALKGTPSLVLSSFLDDYSKEYDRGFADIRRTGAKLEAVSKVALGENSALEHLASTLLAIGVRPRMLEADPGINPPVDRIDGELLGRAFDNLAMSLDIDSEDLRGAWAYEGRPEFESALATFHALRLSFKIVLAIKTVFGRDAALSVLTDPDVLVPGVTARDAIWRRQSHSLQALRAELERRVGGPL